MIRNFFQKLFGNSRKKDLEAAAFKRGFEQGWNCGIVQGLRDLERVLIERQQQVPPLPPEDDGKFG